MGMMIKGKWTDDERIIKSGAFVRQASVYSNALSADVLKNFRAAPGRFHLIASLSCPWSHGAIIVHSLKGLANTVPLQIAGGPRECGYSVNGGDSWPVPGADCCITHLHQLYAMNDSEYTGGASVPLLWDGEQRRIVSNESARIIRAFDSTKNDQNEFDFTLTPEFVRNEIDSLNARVHSGLCNAVYRAGLAQRQSAYDKAVSQVFATLDELENRLSENRLLFGDIITEADWRLFPTIVRFDAVYHTHFRCTRRRLVDYPNLWGYARDLYAWRGIAETVNFAAIREGYYRYDGVHNPFGIVAAQPDADWHAPHDREKLGIVRVALRTGKAVTIEPTTLKPRDE